MVNVCIPTLNSTDTFWKCVESIKKSPVECKIYVIDNGGNLEDCQDLIIHRPLYNLGVAASWNYFIEHTSSPRIITNDDIIFDSFAIERILEYDDGENLIFPENLGNAFSCFYLPQRTIETVGRFDETISPNYAYFEDNDYHYRMQLLGYRIKPALAAFVEHIGSSTLKNFSFAEIESHHRKFRAARQRYIAKWGGEPGKERFTSPYNRG